MIVRIFGIYDSKTKAFMKPFMCMTKGEAIRGFDDLVNGEKSMCSIHPEDFTLFEIGKFDDSNGTYTNFDANETVITALECKKDVPVPPTPEFVEAKKKLQDQVDLEEVVKPGHVK